MCGLVVKFVLVTFGGCSSTPTGMEVLFFYFNCILFQHDMVSFGTNFDVVFGIYLLYKIAKFDPEVLTQLAKCGNC